MFSSEVSFFASNYTAEQKIAITFEQTYVSQAKQNRSEGLLPPISPPSLPLQTWRNYRMLKSVPFD